MNTNNVTKFSLQLIDSNNQIIDSIVGNWNLKELNQIIEYYNFCQKEKNKLEIDEDEEEEEEEEEDKDEEDIIDMQDVDTSKPWYYYHIGLFDLQKNPILNKTGVMINYRGITNDIKHRLAQHNKLIVGGAKSTSKYVTLNGKRREDRMFLHLYTIGPFSNSTDCRRFEPCTKGKCKKTRIEYCSDERLKQINKELKSTPALIKDTIITLNMTKWGSQGNDNKYTPLTINWFYNKIRPDNLSIVLPTNISEHFVTSKEKEELLTLSKRTKNQWIMQPWID